MLEAVNDFYFSMSLHELRAMNGGDAMGGISYNSMLYLNVIDRMSACTVSKLARALGVTKSAVTLKVNELERQGALRRTQSECDRRVYYLTLSEDVERVYAGYDKIFAHMEERLRESYTPEELRQFCEILRTMSSCDWKGFDQL